MNLDMKKGLVYTPFAVHYEKIRNHLCETATNSEKIHSLAQKYEHFRAVARKKLQPRRTHGPLYEISRMKSSNIISLIKK